MVLKGHDLVIQAGGVAIAAAKTCTLNVQADSHEVASPSSSSWKDFMAGRKSWSVSADQLLITPQVYDGFIEAQAFARGGNAENPVPSWIGNRGQRLTANQRGLTLYTIGTTSPYTLTKVANYDTYGSSQQAGDAACASLASWLTTNTPAFSALVSWDAFGMSPDLLAAIASVMGVSLSGIVSPSRQRGALVVFGRGANKGTYGYCPEMNNTLSLTGGTSHARLYLDQGAPLTYNPIKDQIGKVGQIMTLTFRIDGLAYSTYSTVSGSAICTGWKASGSLGSLCGGSFSWKGKGELT